MYFIKKTYKKNEYFGRNYYHHCFTRTLKSRNSPLKTKKKMTADEVIAAIKLLYSGAMTIAYLAFGIANAVISAENKGAKGECDDAIWNYVMVFAILYFFSFANGIYMFVKTIISDGDMKGVNWFGYATIIVSIWACEVYFWADDECAEFYKNNFPNLWNMLFADVVFLFVNIAMIVIIAIIACFVGCFMFAVNKAAEDFAQSKSADYGITPQSSYTPNTTATTQQPHQIRASAPPASALDNTV